MKKTKCYSVRLQSLTQISPKCHKATDWTGNTYLIPDSQYFGRDYSVSKSDAFWIASWIIDKEDCNLMVSTKKEAWYNPAKGAIEPVIIIEKHTPEKINPVQSNYIPELKK